MKKFIGKVPLLRALSTKHSLPYLAFCFPDVSLGAVLSGSIATLLNHKITLFSVTV